MMNAGQQNKIFMIFDDKDGGNPEILAKSYQHFIKENLGKYGVCTLRMLYDMFSDSMRRDLIRGLPDNVILSKSDLNNWCFVAPADLWIEDADPRTIIFTSPLHWIDFEELK
jgi:hypothetical protein